MLKKASKHPMKKQQTPSEDFYKNMEAIIKEAEELGMDKIVLQKVPADMVLQKSTAEIRKVPAPEPVSVPVDNGNLSYDHCQVDTTVDKVITSPVFFMENDNEGGENKFIHLPTPATVTREYLKDYVDISKGIFGDKFDKPNRLFNEILLNEFIKIIETNIYAVFYNGLYNFLKPFLNIKQDQVAQIFKMDTEKDRGFKYRLSSAILSHRDPEDVTRTVVNIGIEVATLVGNMYFDFVNTVMLHGFVNMRDIVAYLAETQLIPFDKISEKQYFMFVEGCLLELAANDVHKIIEIVEANAVRVKAQYELEDYSGKFNFDEDDE